MMPIKTRYDAATDSYIPMRLNPDTGQWEMVDPNLLKDDAGGDGFAFKDPSELYWEQAAQQGILPVKDPGIDFFNQQYGTSFSAPEDYYKYLYGDGSAVDSQYGQGFQIPNFQPGTQPGDYFQNEPLTYTGSGALGMGGKAWMIPALLATAGMAGALPGTTAVGSGGAGAAGAGGATGAGTAGAAAGDIGAWMPTAAEAAATPSVAGFAPGTASAGLMGGAASPSGATAAHWLDNPMLDPAFSADAAISAPGAETLGEFSVMGSGTPGATQAGGSVGLGDVATEAMNVLPGTPEIPDLGKTVLTHGALTALDMATTPKPFDPTGDLLASEEERQAAIRAASGDVDAAFSGFDDDYYNTLRQSYLDYQMPRFLEEAEDARYQLPMSFARTDNSSYANELGDLERDILRSETDIRSQAGDVANRRRQDVERERGNLLSQAELGAGLGGIASQARSSAAALEQPPAFSPIADLFTKYTTAAANRSLARRLGYGKPGVTANASRDMLFDLLRGDGVVSYVR
jgi:hypothetical protein